MQHRYQVQIEGISPLLQANPKAAQSELYKNKKRSASRQDPTEQWRAFIYRADDEKTLLHPSRAMETLLKEAAKDFKASGRRGSMSIPVKRTCWIEGDWLTLCNKTEPDKVREMNPRNKAGQLVQYYAPEFSPGWRMEFILDLHDDELVQPGHLKEILDYGGQRIGIGVDRPKYGRFIVTKFLEIEESKAAKGNGKKAAAA